MSTKNQTRRVTFFLIGGLAVGVLLGGAAYGAINLMPSRGGGAAKTANLADPDAIVGDRGVDDAAARSNESAGNTAASSVSEDAENEEGGASDLEGVEAEFGDEEAATALDADTPGGGDQAATAPSSTTTTLAEVGEDDLLADHYRKIGGYNSELGAIAAAFNSDIRSGKASERTTEMARALLKRHDTDKQALFTAAVAEGDAASKDRLLELYELIEIRGFALHQACLSSRMGISYAERLQQGHDAKVKFDRLYPEAQP